MRVSPWQVVATVSLGTVMLVLNSTALNIALPLVVEHYRAGPFAAAWIVLGFMLPQAALLVVSGRMADSLDRRAVYLAGLGCFTLASLAAGWAGSAGMLIAIRVLQGAAGALVMANGTALIASAVPRERLSQSMGVYLGAMATAPLLGPSLGGYLAQNLGWQWVFWLNVPAGITALVWGAIALPRSAEPAREPIDLIGGVLLAAWLGSLVLGLSQAGSAGWGAASSYAPLALAPVLLAGFTVRQRAARNPLIDSALFRDPTFVLGSIAAPLNALGWIGNVFLMSLYLQNVQGMSTAQAGLAILPGPLVGMLASPVGGYLGRRFAPQWIAVYGMAASTAGLGLSALFLAEGTPYALIAAAMILVTAGSGVFYTANTTMIMIGVPERRLGVANGVRLTMQNLGTVLSPAICLTAASSQLAAEDRHLLYASASARPQAGTLAALVAGYRLSFAVLFLASLLATAVVLAGARSAAKPTA